MRILKVMGCLSIVAVVAMYGVSASATSYGTDVTLWDNINGTTGWTGSPTNVDPRTDILGDRTREDEEVTVGAVIGQQWDLEGMYFNHSTHVLTLVGGYDFRSGVLHNGVTYDGGDIFLAVNPVLAAAPAGVEPSNPTGAGFDYVIDIDYALGTYQVYSIAGLTVGNGLLGVTDFGSSNPWLYDAASGLGTDLGIGGNVSFSGALDQATFAATLGATGGEYTPVGGTHFIMSGFDLSWLYTTMGGGYIYTHYTYECGNDVLAGYIPVPLPGAAFLGLLGGAMVIAKRRFSKGAVVA